MPSRADFLLRDDVIFFNHGSFGACPRTVFARYQAWQRELERQPVDFFMRRAPKLLADARKQIARYFNAAADDIVFVSNATTGLSRALRSLPLEAGDEILTTSHEYGAVNRLLDFVAAKTGARVVRHRVALPYQSDAAFADAFFADATSRTRAIVLSHIASPSSLIFPVRRICQRARQSGILTVVDGAHAPGQLPVDLGAIDADMYSGNFHKWLCAPKGSGFLHVRRELQHRVDPLVISHGSHDEAGFIERHQWLGTRDISAFLAVPAAIDFQREHDWSAVTANCHALAKMAQARICERFGQEPLSRDQFAQMVTIPLPACDAAAVGRALLEGYGIEIPAGEFVGRPGIRLSVQAYNTRGEIERLIEALEASLG